MRLILCVTTFVTLTASVSFGSTEGCSPLLIPSSGDLAVGATLDRALFLRNQRDVSSTIDERILTAFDQMQEKYGSDKPMWDWVLTEVMPTQIYRNHVAKGLGIQGPIEGFAGRKRLVLIELITHFPSIKTVLVPLFQMRWEGSNTFNIPAKYRILPEESRPIEVRDAAELYGDFSHVEVTAKTFFGRGFIPIKPGIESRGLKFKVVIRKDMKTNESSLTVSASFESRDESESIAVRELLRRAFPGHPINEVGGSRARQVYVESYSAIANDSSFAVVVETLRILSEEAKRLSTEAETKHLGVGMNL